jgi:hypothetical protein
VSQVILGGYKPSSAVEFTAEAQGFMGPFLEFLARTGAPLMASVYPYFTYATNPSTMDLSYALFTARAPSYGTHVEAPARRWRGGTEEVVFFNVIRERNGRPSGYTWVGRVDVGEKKFHFWQKRSSNCDSMGLPPYPLPKLYDGWVQCEG